MKERGIVTSCNNETGVGFVSETRFRSVDFSSGSPARFPEVGEKVELVSTKGEMVSVRAIP